MAYVEKKEMGSAPKYGAEREPKSGPEPEQENESQNQNENKSQRARTRARTRTSQSALWSPFEPRMSVIRSAAMHKHSNMKVGPMTGL